MHTQEPQNSSARLQDSGWTRRFTALGKRLNEAVELYGQLGFEILLESAYVDAEDGAGAEACKNCIVTSLARTIYTRPRGTV